MERTLFPPSPASSSSAIDGFWAKLSVDPEHRVTGWHSVGAHSADVAACFAALLEQPVIRQRVARLAGLSSLDDVQAARLAVFAALHDVGKFNHGFQDRALPKSAAVCGHVREAIALFGHGDGARFAEALRLGEMVTWGAEDDTVERLLLAALAHHGRPIPVGQGHVPARWRATPARDPLAGVADLASRVRQWFPLAFQAGGAPLPGSEGLQHVFNGLLSLADWIGSDESNFHFVGGDDEGRFDWALGRARHTLKALGLDASAMRASLGAISPGFEAISRHSPSAIQSLIANLPEGGCGSLTVLESETGSGKTEAALARFMTLFHAGCVDGLYFALPTRTAATQIHRRVTLAMARAFPAEHRPAVVLAVPGYLAVDEVTGQRTLPGFEVLWNDDDRERWRFRGWAAERPKRFLAGTIVVGTIDQVLLSTLMVPHAHLRAAALLRHLLVVDEVHASDAYMTRLLEEVLARHRRAGGHALLMSATLGSTARERLLAPGERTSIPPLENACDVPYPLVTHVGADARPERMLPGSGPPARAISVSLLPVSGDATAVASVALGAARGGARVLVIRNTVRDCLATQAALEQMTVASGEGELLFSCYGVVAPHHARFSRDDRILLDRALESRFGKEAPTVACVAVTTQTVQQSLDMDADFLLSDLCPVDVLLQRLGRLHRHERYGRPSGFERPSAVVLVPEDRDVGKMIRRDGLAAGPHGFGRVYENLTVLEATWRLLEEHETLTIPAMSRMLVERATHPEALRALEEELGDRWPSHGLATRGVYLAHGRLASLNVVDWSVGFGELAFPEGELSREIGTRLGESDRLARFTESFAGPFGTSVVELTLAAHLTRGVAGDAAPEDVDVSAGTIQFTLGTRRYVYDRLGLRPLEAASGDTEVSDG